MRESNFSNILKVINREAPDRPTLFEFFLNAQLYERLVGEKAPVWTPSATFDRFIAKAFRAAGYDYCTLHASGFGFPAKTKSHAKTISLNENLTITDKKSFEEYNWQNPDSFDYSHFTEIADDLPKNFKIMAYGPGGVLENVMRLVGYDNLCFMIYEDKQLVYDIFEKVGTGLLGYYKNALKHKTVGIMMSNDDWGFNTQTMLSPEQMREFVFPWHKKLVELGHSCGLPVLLHSCGNLNEIMDDIVDHLGYDGKHSYEDVIVPVEQFYEKWHDKIAILGGIDVDFVTTKTPEEIKVRCSAMLKRAQSGYALGTGNSVPGYIPHENYFAMITCATGEKIHMIFAI